jgi:acetyl esterase/lipase
MNKRNHLLALLVLSLIAFSTSNAQPTQGRNQLEDPPWLKEFLHKRIVYSVPGMKQVRARKDLTYRRVDGEDLKADIYLPNGVAKNARRPAVIFIHGGRLPPNLLTKPKDWAVYVSFGQLIGASGFVGVTFNHRFHTWDSLADSRGDVAEMIAYVRTNADKFQVDPDRIFLWAVSAGGIFLAESLREVPPYISGLIAYYSVLDLHTDRQKVPASVTDDTLKNHSPLYQLGQTKGKLPPIFIARAGLDSPELNSGLDRFVAVALTKNATVDVSNHSDGHHGFDIEDNNERTREIIRRTVEFIKVHQ